MYFLRIEGKQMYIAWSEEKLELLLVSDPVSVVFS